jgi:outer membrane immunogenic protein
MTKTSRSLPIFPGASRGAVHGIQEPPGYRGAGHEKSLACWVVLPQDRVTNTRSMKKVALTSLVIFTFCSLAYAGPEAFHGKEMKQVVPLPEPCPINWTGFYIGGHVGYGFNGADTHNVVLPLGVFNQTPATVDPEEDGFFGGLQLGYNHQLGKLVLGVETDFSGSTMDGTTTVSPILLFGTPVTNSHITVHQDTDWFGTLRGRIGFTPTCRLLVYGTGGLAWGDVNYSANSVGGAPQQQYPGSASETKVGWTGGGGVEFALSKRWSLKLEYLYYDLGDQTFTSTATPPNPPFNVRYTAETKAHTFNSGLNFKF